MRPSDRAVRKASSKRLLRDMARAAQIVRTLRMFADLDTRKAALAAAARQTSRTRYACLMTAWGM